jgi:hypothetical protein
MGEMSSLLRARQNLEQVDVAETNYSYGLTVLCNLWFVQSLPESFSERFAFD